MVVLSSRLLRIWVGLSLFAACRVEPPPAELSAPGAPRYVFLFIGDGMGLPQVELAELYQQRAAGVIPSDRAGRLSFTKFPVSGLVRTHSRNSLITDSAAAATAIATGHKADQMVISRESATGPALTNLTYPLRAQGWRLGIVTSTSLDHATPAVFYTHQEQRRHYYEIAAGLAKSNVDFVAGGGFRYPTGRDGDRPSVLKHLEEAGFRVVNNLDEVAPGGGRTVFISPHQDSKQAMPFEIDRPAEAPRLAHLVTKSIEVLSGGPGFFMMVEGGKIDWACHANDAATAVHETLELSAAVAQAVKWYEQHPDETLILVTADHETGGLGLGYTGRGYQLFPERLAHQKSSFRVFGELVEQRLREQPKATWQEALGWVQEHFGLLAPQGDAATKLAALPPPDYDPADPRGVGMRLTDAELRELREAFELSRNPVPAKQRTEAQRLRYADYQPLAVTAARILGRKAGVSWTTFFHTAAPVPLYALGRGSESFSGVLDNTEIAGRILKLTEAKARPVTAGAMSP